MSHAPPDLRAVALLRILDERGTIARAEAREPPDDEDGKAKRARFFADLDEVRRVADRLQLRLELSTTHARHAAVDRLREATRVGEEELKLATEPELVGRSRGLALLEGFVGRLEDGASATAGPAIPGCEGGPFNAGCSDRAPNTCTPRTQGSMCSRVEASGCLSPPPTPKDRSTMGDATTAVAGWARSA